MRCVYLRCSNLLDESTEQAHVMTKAIGGRLRTNERVCSKCNHRTQPIETELVDGFRPFAAALGTFGGSNRATPGHRVRVPEGLVELNAGTINTLRNDAPSVIVGDERMTAFHGSDLDSLVTQTVDRMFRDRISPENFRLEIERDESGLTSNLQGSQSPSAARRSCVRS
jgi:hypothetical protein